MLCPHCSSTSIVGPVETGREAHRGALMRCLGCGHAFDAYQAFGSVADAPQRRAA